MTSIKVQCEVEKTEHCQKLLAKNMQCNGRPLKSLAFRTVHPALNSSVKGLRVGWREGHPFT